MFGIFGVLLVAVRPSIEPPTGWTERETSEVKKNGILCERRRRAQLHSRDHSGICI